MAHQVNPQALVRAVANSGLKIAKSRLQDAIRATPEQEFFIIQDPGTRYALVRIKLA